MTTTTPAWAREVGLSYRQLDYWVRKGYLKPRTRAGRNGAGFAREWPRGERERALLMGRLVRVGFRPPHASLIAVAVASSSEGRVTLADGITLVVQR